MYETTYGTKYEATKDLSRVEIAKLIRADIKAAVKAGTLPAAKYSVTCQSYSGGGSINIKVADVNKEGFVLHNEARLRWDLENPHAGLYNAPSNVRDLYSPEAVEMKKTLEGIMGAYNYDGSDIQSDYFNVRFYGGAEIDWRYADAQKELQLLRIKGEQVAEQLEIGAPANGSALQAEWLESIGAL
jgi:hypothetical protein